MDEAKEITSYIYTILNEFGAYYLPNASLFYIIQQFNFCTIYSCECLYIEALTKVLRLYSIFLL